MGTLRVTQGAPCSQGPSVTHPKLLRKRGVGTRAAPPTPSPPQCLRFPHGPGRERGAWTPTPHSSAAPQAPRGRRGALARPAPATPEGQAGKYRARPAQGGPVDAPDREGLTGTRRTAGNRTGAGPRPHEGLRPDPARGRRSGGGRRGPSPSCCRCLSAGSGVPAT